jgi:hypothetical protein
VGLKRKRSNNELSSPLSPTHDGAVDKNSSVKFVKKISFFSSWWQLLKILLTHFLMLF